MHDGVSMRFRKTSGGYDPTDREAAYCARKSNATTAARSQRGSLYMEEGSGGEMHTLNKTVPAAARRDSADKFVCPGSKALDDIMAEFR